MKKLKNKITKRRLREIFNGSSEDTVQLKVYKSRVDEFRFQLNWYIAITSMLVDDYDSNSTNMIEGIVNR